MKKILWLLISIFISINLGVSIANEGENKMFKMAKEDAAVWQEMAIDRYSKALGIDYNLAIAICNNETNGKTNIVKPEGQGINNLTIGPFQLKYGTAKMVGFKGDPADLLDININTRYALKYFRRCKRKHNGNIKLALAEYNAGRIKRDSRGLIKNRRYVNRVLNIQKLLKAGKVTPQRALRAHFKKVYELYHV